VADIANNGREALALWNSGVHCLVLTDIHMPEMDGYELTNEIRRAEAKTAAYRTPVIALTAIAMSGEAEKCKTMGMDGYLVKPTPLLELKAILETWLPDIIIADVITEQASAVGSADIQPTRSQIANVSAEASAWEDWVPGTLAGFVGDNAVKIRRFLNLFLLSADEQLKSFEAALLANDAVKIGKTAHTLKSAASYVGALRIAKLCKELEVAAKHADLAVCKAKVENIIEAFAVVRQLINQYLGCR
jgi:CheY-like chemotaxis protein/HPt (histidine-containing phosphotransfer) domain-containing protein